MSKRKVTEETVSKIISTYNDTHSIKQTAQLTFLSTYAVKKVLKEECIEIFRGLSKEEMDNISYDYINGMTIKELSIKYNKDSSTIIGRLRKLGIHQRAHHRYTKEEIEDIGNHYPMGDFEYIFDKYPFLTKRSLFVLMSKNNIHRENFYWTEEEINFLKESAQLKKPVIDIYHELNKKYTILAIQTKMGKLNLLHKIVWTDEELEVLRKYYPIIPIDEVCAMIPNHHRKSIIERACELGIRSVYSVDKPILISKLQDYIRGNNSYWINASIKLCNNRCVITGDDDFEIHHLYSVNTMILEALEYCNIPNDPTVILSIEDKERVLNAFQTIQNSHPLGVCIHPEIHKAFHKEYGYGDNTEDQWNNFISKYTK